MVSKYRPGQLWNYVTNQGQEKTKLLILKTECLEGQTVIHVTVIDGGLNMPSHMPFDEAAIDESVTSLLSEQAIIPDFQEGYNYWRSCFQSGKAGIYDMTVSEALALS